MKKRAILIIAICMMALAAFCRFVDIHTISQLISESKLTFVGRIKAIKLSGITTHLSYPTWQNATFSWLTMEVEVLEPVKGVQKGQVVQTMVLSIGETSSRFGLINAPGTLEPKVGNMYLFFLGPTPITNAFAALTAPYDDNRSIFLLDRKDPEYVSYRKARGKGPSLDVDDERYDLIWTLVDDDKKLVPSRAEEMRRKYAKEIETTPSAKLIYLEWESKTNSHGWFSDVPKGVALTNSTDTNQARTNSVK
jgi:hypothetical protein